MKRYIESISRDQGTLFPDHLEDWVKDENVVRVEAFAESNWGQRYPTIAMSWRRHWQAMIPFLPFLMTSVGSFTRRMLSRP